MSEDGSERWRERGREKGRRGWGEEREGGACRVYYLMTCDMCGLNFVIYPDSESEMA